MFSVLKVPSEKMKDKLIKQVEERVTSVCNELSYRVSFEELMINLEQGFKLAWDKHDVVWLAGDPSPEEKSLAEKIGQEKYLQKEWNFKR
jgi:lipoate-protein ligase A